MKTKKLLILLPIILFSCSKSNTETEGKQSTVKEVFEPQGEFKKLGGDIIHSFGSGCFYDVEVLDSLVMIGDRCGQYNFHLYHTDGRQISEFGSTGEGPDQFQLPLIRQKDNEGVWIHDVNHKTLKFFGAEKLLTGNSVPDEKIILSSEMLGGFEVSKVAEDRFVGINHINGRGLFFTYDDSNGELLWKDFEPKVSNMPSENKVPLLYSSFISFEPNSQRFALAYRYFNKVNIYNSKSELLSSTQIGPVLDPDFSVKSKWMIPDEAVYAFLDISVNKRGVYLLYAGLPQNQILTEDGYPRRVEESFMFVLDWEGELISRFELDKYLSKFSVDPSSNMIFGVTEDFENGDKIIVKYNLNEEN